MFKRFLLALGIAATASIAMATAPSKFTNQTVTGWTLVSPTFSGVTFEADAIDGASFADIIGLDAVAGTAQGFKNTATGSVILNFHDYADSADDDMAHVVFTSNCTDATTGAEDCDFTIGVVEGGAAAETRFHIDGDGGNIYGSANTASHTFTSDGTGDAEEVHVAESIGPGEILNITRSIPLPLMGWSPCAGTLAGVWDAAGADAEPDIAALNTALVIEYDDTGGEVDTDEICTSFTVPADYASGGTFVIRAIQGAATGANIESIEARISVDGAATGAADEDNLADSAAVQTVTSAPTGTWAAGASIGIALKQGNASADDVVNILSIEAQYTAVQ